MPAARSHSWRRLGALRVRRRGTAVFVLCAVTFFAVACQQRPAGADRPPDAKRPANSTLQEGSADMDRSSGKSSPRSSLGPAALAFDRYGLVPETAFDDELRAVAAAERAYAAQAVRDGMKSASLHWMLPGATVFDPEPRDAATSFGSWDERTQPRLEWQPQRVEVSAAGDVAVSTGPYRVFGVDDDSTRSGQFCSVWQRQGDGSWRVVADLGTPHPGVAEWPTTTWGRRVQVESPRAAVVPDALPLVTGLEKALAEDVAEFGADAALARSATADIHLLRAGVPARMGKEFLGADAALGASEHDSTQIELTGAVAAASNDFAAGWGVATHAEGHRDAFLRVWRREQTRWLVAFDVRVPLVER